MSVPNSLRKLRAICIAIDVSPQRFERFIGTQQHLPPKERLSVIRDVKTRWNSTYDMCERAIKLQKYIDEWLQQEIALKTSGNTKSTSSVNDYSDVDFRDLNRLQLSNTEWQHLKLVTKMLARFKEATSFLSKNQQTQIPFIWLMYNTLFDFLEKMTNELGEDLGNPDNIHWPEVVRAAADKGRSKLSKYYARTDDNHGYLYNCAAILDPSQKLTVYEDDSWGAQDKHIYRQQFLDYLDRYDSLDGKDLTPASNAVFKGSQGSEWFRKPSVLQLQSSRSPPTGEAEDEIGATRQEGESYLSTPCVIKNKNKDFDILQWWKVNEETYPRLAQVAKDILAIPIAQVGVERVFNVAKDLIGDRRHRLSAQKIRQIMILKHTITQEHPIDSPDCRIEEDQMSYNEVDDLFELPANFELMSEAPVEVSSGSDSSEEDLPTISLPPRKRVRPSRFCD